MAPGVVLVGSSGLDALGLLAVQCLLLPWLSLAVGSIAIGVLAKILGAFL
jgi:hypothetical protein